MKSFNSKSCIICDNHNPNNFTVLTKSTRQGKGLWKKCNNCGLAVNFNGVDPKNHNQFYKKKYFEINSLKRGSYLNAEKHFKMRLPSVKQKFLKIKKFVNKKMDVLEIGSASGELAYCLNNYVKSYTCFELNPEYVEFINKELSIKAYSEDFMNIKLTKKYDLIILINTLDHLYNPNIYMSKIKKILKKNGLLYIEIPNDNQIMNSEFMPPFNNNFSKFMYQIAHYYSFNKETIVKYLNKFNFKEKNISFTHNYNFLNFINWYLVGKPQDSYYDATDFSKLNLNNKKIALKFNILLRDMDKNMRNFLNKNELSETINILSINN